MEIKPGTDLGQYIIEKEIAEGGMGQIFEAKEKSLGRKVAIKTIKHLLLDRNQVTERFKNEAKIVAQLNHPNIVTIHSFVEEKYFDYIVMEYVNGETLHDLIVKNKLSIEQKINVVDQILNGIQAAHQVEIIHRDLKPNNIMLDQNGSIKILDFGLAKTIDTHDNSFTSTNAIVGTTYYLSPEVAKGNKPTKLSDIYSTGIVLYELFTGDLPFKADTPLGTIEKIKSEILTPPHQINPNIPSYISKIILKMCEKNPEKRYQNIAEIQFDLMNPTNEIKSNATSQPKTTRKPNPTESFISLGFEQNEVDEVIQIARQLQEKKDNHLGRSTILSIGEELHIDPDIIDKAAKQFHKQKKYDRHQSNNFGLYNDNLKRDYPAGILSRILAWCLDSVFIALFLIPTLFLSPFIYVPLCHKLFNGQTFGQMLFGIRTVSCNGKPLTFQQIIIDYCGYFFMFIDILLGLFLSWGENQQRLMQSVANTKVISNKCGSGNIFFIIIILLFILPFMLFFGISIQVPSPSTAGGFNGIGIIPLILIAGAGTFIFLLTIILKKSSLKGKAIVTTLVCILLLPIILILLTFTTTQRKLKKTELIAFETDSIKRNLVNTETINNTRKIETQRISYSNVNFTVRNENGEIIPKALVTWIKVDQIFNKRTSRSEQSLVTSNGKINRLSLNNNSSYYFLVEEEYKENYQPMLIGPVNPKNKEDFDITLYNGRTLLLKVIDGDTQENIKGADFSYLDNNNKVINRTNWPEAGLDSLTDEKGFLPETQWPLTTFDLVINKKGYQPTKIKIDKNTNQNELKTIKLHKIY